MTITFPKPNWDLDDPDYNEPVTDDDYEYEDTPAIPIYTPEEP